MSWSIVIPQAAASRGRRRHRPVRDRTHNQNAFFRSSSTVEQAAVKADRSVTLPKNCSIF
jgi:hypothetical protein